MHGMAHSDEEAWYEYPHHRRWFDKLWLSLRLGHRCGPGGTAPEQDGTYIVRPIYNLEGMGVGASRKFIAASNYSCVPPGYFWCEWFDGPQHSVTYEWDDEWEDWVAISSWRGELEPGSLTRFRHWKRSDWSLPLPKMFNELADCKVINVEFINTRIIEVHLRPSPDPQRGMTVVPVWSGQEAPVGMVEAFEDCSGFLEPPRLGFMIY